MIAIKITAAALLVCTFAVICLAWMERKVRAQGNEQLWWD